ncbi:hypothetical protein ABB37_01439 [Leptomonas pyrrhocoris]|uniref:Guanine nucleotide-binding protein subunit beta-like protein n=1 Tax=Leptomonas pyrrhocoris TaxID=157538 RepID=A0A0N0DZ83_LEPPY|nr:hypothetical protein ABB37_01439 [Leptomonas pyrrhocoris]XP_015663448.1 hypothetical protein ABB37_01439 [Leptomonas pyrrhocoris]KPA85008.1 hypothetical protein ABB37_01439 [Leptomonas pyrrhocoris]KPA85009.1 hypothetical protein ABB37_01439 [Leptomonas pyrrhocoris]|eukprot:XP_015663447.1 hypothetical protein ABB37_01439 [Leptomonas pyrrhocoris]
MTGEGYYKGQAHLRRLYAAPDSPNEIIATCDKAYVPYLTYTPATRSVAVSPKSRAGVPRVSLPFPAIDLAWCPFKKGESEASFVTASRDQPLQLWDVEDASLRASYVATNDSDYHVHAHAVCWFGSASHPHWIAGGYGGFEDATAVRVFDVLVEGSQPVWAYSATRSHGLVSALRDCSWPGTTSLLAVGYHNVPSVHLIDCRSRCPAAELHGLQHGVQTLRVSAEDPLRVYAGGSQGDGRIACWDLRRPRAPVFTLARPAKTNQVFEFDLLPSPSPAAPRRLVTTSSAGGVVLYSWAVGSAPSDGTGTVFGTSVGPTSGLTVVDAATVVVTSGSRVYGHYSRNLLTAAKESGSPSGAKDAAGDEGSYADAPAFPQRRRARSPMTDGSDDEGGSAGRGASDGEAAAEATNAAVIALG